HRLAPELLTELLRPFFRSHANTSAVLRIFLEVFEVSTKPGQVHVVVAFGCSVRWDLAPSGISRRLGFRAPRDFAPLMPCAVRSPQLAWFVPCSAVCCCLHASCHASRRPSGCSPATACATLHASRD